MNYFQDITDFHEKFGLAYNGKPRILPDSMSLFRIAFMTEELTEYVNSHKVVEQSIPHFLDHALDSLVDLVYVALGTAYLHGFDFDEAWRRVHHANMLKVRATSSTESKRNSTLDVIKPPGWMPPSHLDLVMDHAHAAEERPLTKDYIEQHPQTQT